MKFYDVLKPVNLQTNVLEHAIGAILLQEDRNNVNIYIAFILQTLSDWETLYRSTEREALMLTWSN